MGLVPICPEDMGRRVMNIVPPRFPQHCSLQKVDTIQVFMEQRQA